MASGSRLWRAMSLIAPLLLSHTACGKRTVPFKREPSAAATPAAARDASAALGLAQGVVYPAETHAIEHHGRKIALDGSIHASLELPSPTPGIEPELLLAVQGGDGTLSLQRWQSDGQGFQLKEHIATLVDAALHAQCTVEAARLAMISPTTLAARADLRCEGPPGGSVADQPPTEGHGSGEVAVRPTGDPAKDTPPSPGASDVRSEHRLWAVELETTAHVVEQVVVQHSAADAIEIDPSMESRDLDNDGHADLLLVLAVTSLPETTPMRIELKLFDRASGWVRDTTEPEKTLRALADRAVAADRKRDPRAESFARRVIAIHDSMCRESGSPRLMLSGRGLECGPSLGAGRAASVLVSALAAQNKLLQALDAYGSLSSPVYQLAEADRARAQNAVRSHSEPGGYTWRVALTLDPIRAPRVRRAAIAFIDDVHLLLRGPSPRSYDLSSGRLTALGIAASMTIADPSGRFAITSVTRSCEGYHLGIVRASQVVAGFVTGATVSQPLIARAQPPPGAHCPTLDPEQQRDQGGYRVLEWTPAGVLIEKDHALSLLALDASASASAPARMLGAHDPLPSLAHSGNITPDGRYHVWLTPIAIGIHDRQRDVVRFLSPPNNASAMPDIAISPDGRTLALVRGNQLLIGTFDSTARPPVP